MIFFLWLFSSKLSKKSSACRGLTFVIPQPITNTRTLLIFLDLLYCTLLLENLKNNKKNLRNISERSLQLTTIDSNVFLSADVICASGACCFRFLHFFPLCFPSSLLDSTPNSLTPRTCYQQKINYCRDFLIILLVFSRFKVLKATKYGQLMDTPQWSHIRILQKGQKIEENTIEKRK